MKNFKELINQTNIEIPMLQRDYAQGRSDDKTTKIRNKFLETIFKSLDENKPLHLDFIYGSYDKDKFIPLDGQQRLTTLFLLHWYFGLKNGDLEFLKDENKSKFSYETRVSSREFCDFLLNLELDFNKNLVEQIKDSAKFMPFWENDPTIKSMLTMIDAIDIKFKGKNFINELDNIKFSFYELKNFGLSNDLYIKMNARGKQLSEFEIFKADFETLLEKYNFNDELTKFSQDIDNKWADTFWKYKDENMLIDSAFMSYFYYISEMLWYKDNEINDENKDLDIENKIPEIYKNKENVEFFFDSLDKFGEIEEKSKFLDMKFVNLKFIDMLKSCENLNEKLNISEKILLFILINSVVKNMDDDKIKSYLRVAKNITQNTNYKKYAALEWKNDVREYHINPMIKAFSGDEMSLENLKNIEKFSKNMINQEIKKLEKIKQEPRFAKYIFELENSDELKCDISYVLCDDLELFEKRAEAFLNIFSNTSGDISRALLALDDDAWVWIGTAGGYPKYHHGYKNTYRYIFDRKGDLLTKLLDEYINGKNLKDIASDYLNSNPIKDYRYYFIKYRSFLDEIDYKKDECESKSGKFSNVFVWRNNDKGYDIEKMSSPSLRGVYINPFIYEALNNAEFYSDLNYITFAKIDGFIDEIYCFDDGWHIKFNENFDTSKITLEKSEDEKFILKHDQNSDTIQNLKDFLNSIKN